MRPNEVGPHSSRRHIFFPVKSESWYSAYSAHYCFIQSSLNRIFWIFHITNTYTVYSAYYAYSDWIFHSMGGCLPVNHRLRAPWISSSLVCCSSVLHTGTAWGCFILSRWGNNGTEHLMTFQAQVVIRPRAAVTQLDPAMGNQAIIIAAVKNETAVVKIFFSMNMQSVQNMFWIFSLWICKVCRTWFE